MSSESYLSYRRPWDSYRGSRTTTKSSMSSSLFASPRAPPSGKRILRLASSSLPDASERMDLAQASSINTELLGLRSQEREQLVDDELLQEVFFSGKEEVFTILEGRVLKVKQMKRAALLQVADLLLRLRHMLEGESLGRMGKLAKVG